MKRVPLSDFKTFIVQTLFELKHQPFGTCTLSGKKDRTSFRLTLLTADQQQDRHVISLLTRWRKKHERWFQAQFPVSNPRTTRWYRERLTDTPDRLLFLISVGDIYFGHIGLFRFDFENNTCDIDNIVRGRKGYPGLIESAILLMMAWGKRALRIKAYTLSTTSDNKRALALYTRLGFVETKRNALTYKDSSEGGEWVQAPKSYKKKIERYEVFMKTT